MADGQKEFDENLAREQVAGLKDRIETGGIGVGPDGEVNAYPPGQVPPRRTPTIIGPDGEEDDLRAAYEAAGGDDEPEDDD